MNEGTPFTISSFGLFFTQFAVFKLSILNSFPKWSVKFIVNFFIFPNSENLKILSTFAVWKFEYSSLVWYGYNVLKHLFIVSDVENSFASFISPIFIVTNGSFLVISFINVFVYFDFIMFL